MLLDRLTDDLKTAMKAREADRGLGEAPEHARGGAQEFRNP